VAFISGVLLVDAPGSALNNAGQEEGGRTENKIAVKKIGTARGFYPYVSAQAFRYWLRTTIQQTPSLGWQAAPVFREAKIAYTDANPLRYWDDDLFGYMRAASKRAGAAERRAADPTRASETPTSTEITRASPFRASPLISLGPVSIADDFGTMTRHEGDPVPHEHEFYRAVLKGLFSLDLRAAGTFTYVQRTGFLNLDTNRREEAARRHAQGTMEHLEQEKAYRLPFDERHRRVRALLGGLGLLAGGAKQALHYTDVTPVVMLAVVTRGGNNPLHYVLGPGDRGDVAVNEAALEQAVTAWHDQFLSPLYAGWVRGFQDAQRVRLSEALARVRDRLTVAASFEGDGIGHPRQVLERLATDLGDHPEWWE
jgi:CRISPR-associated protein Cst2